MQFLPLTLILATLAPSPSLQVRTDFPGGSAKVEAIDAKEQRLALLPGGRKERGWVCWWYGKVEGLRSGETLTLDVGGGVWATPDRAAFSTDGRTWQHTEPGKREKGGRIVYRVKVDQDHVWVAWGPPFTNGDAEEVLKAAAARCPEAKVFELCKSKKGRPVRGLRIEAGSKVAGKRPVIWVQARQHAWEAGSSWVCRGFVEWITSDDPRAVALRQSAVIVIVPIMDVDNVEEGQGGKDQVPHDHNRDWSAKPVHPEVAAAMAELRRYRKKGKVALFLDLHNPAASDRQPFFFIPARELLTTTAHNNLQTFLDRARLEIRGPLTLAVKARESGRGYDPNWEKISGNWAAKHLGEEVVAACLETSWNTPHSLPKNYRRVGRELGQAMERYLGPGRK